MPMPLPVTLDDLRLVQECLAGTDKVVTAKLGGESAYAVTI